MNFVISDVKTVADDEEENVLIVPNDQNYMLEVDEDPLSSSNFLRPIRYTKNCFVPLCPNTTKSAPDKMFAMVPTNPERRAKWMVAARRLDSKNPKTPFHCCQDHFDLEKEMVNFQLYLKMGSSNGRLHMNLIKHTIPSIFICRQFGHLSRKQRISILRKIHDDIIFNKVDRNTAIKRYSRMIRPFNTKNSTTSTPKAVIISMPQFQDEVQPEYYEIEPKNDVIIIDDSDDDE